MDNLKNTIVFLDVRNVWEYKEQHLEGSILIPLEELKIKAKAILPNKNIPIFIFCLTGIRSRVARKLLEDEGYTNIVGEGTIEAAKNFKKNNRVSKLF